MLKKSISLFFLFLLSTVGVLAQIHQRPTPSTSQLRWARAELGVIFHYDLHVFDGKKYNQTINRIHPVEDYNIFNPTELDTDFWGMDEWYVDGKEIGVESPISFERANNELMFHRMNKKLRMPEENIHYPEADTSKYIKSWNTGVRCAVMQGGQGDTKHWAFNDPVKREGKYKDNPPSLEEYKKLTTRVVDLHPITCMQNARTSAGGVVTGIPSQALTVGPVQTWQAEKVSIWQAGVHDNPFGQRLTALMIGKKIIDSAVPMSLLADHPNVQFNYYRGGLGTCGTEMH